MSDTERQGGCACGAVRYRTAGEPIFVNNCHCTLCQRQSGTGSAVNAFFEAERVTLLSGMLASHGFPTGSGGVQHIFRCTVCGSAVWSHFPSLGSLGVAVKVGTLDDARSVTPDAVIYLSTKLPWVPDLEGIPCFQENYKVKDVLPPDRLARLFALADRKKALQA